MSLFQVTKKQVIENYELRTMTGDIVSFTPSYSQLLPDPFSDLNVTVNVEATGGNGTPDNPIPINGYTEANITRCGVNLFDGTKVTTTHPSNWSVTFENDNLTIVHKTAYVSGAPIFNLDLPSGTYVISYTATQLYKVSLYINGVYNKVLNNGMTFTIENGNTYSVAFTAENNSTNVISNIQIETGNTASISEYSEYTGNTYTVNFGQTVYGGVLDVTRGKLKPCIEYPSYNGETLSGRWLSSEATYVEGTTPPTGSQVVSLDDYGTDIDLTPEVISAVVGTNNVFADCGNITVKCLI